MVHPRQDFTNEICYFLNACPGPPMLRSALRIAALQDVDGIVGLSSSDRGERSALASYPQHGMPNRTGQYLRTVAGAAFTVNLLGRTPAQLPTVPLSFWIREAVKAVFLAAAGARGVPAVGKRRAK